MIINCAADLVFSYVVGGAGCWLYFKWLNKVLKK
jgi:hypothetical protein